MEWKFFDKEEPTEEGLYLTYTATGNINLNRWKHIWLDEEGDVSLHDGRGHKDAGFAFLSKIGSYKLKRVSGIVLFAAIPSLPDEVSEKQITLAKYKAQIKELKARIKALEGE